eukprot:5935834-Amphidinium_carterae.3
MGMHFHPSQFGVLQHRYIAQAWGELESGALEVAGVHPYVAVLFCDLRILAPNIGHVQWHGEHFTSWTLTAGRLSVAFCCWHEHTPIDGTTLVELEGTPRISPSQSGDPIAQDRLTRTSLVSP